MPESETSRGAARAPEATASFCCSSPTKSLSGVGIALFDRWGAVWYLSTAVPLLRSLVRLQPDPSTVTGLPVFIQSHFIEAENRESSPDRTCYLKP